MDDLIFIALMLACFGLLTLFVAGCRRLQ